MKCHNSVAEKIKNKTNGREVVKKKLSWFDRMMVAVTFAEANEPAKAKEHVPEISSSPVKHNGTRKNEILISTKLHAAETKS